MKISMRKCAALLLALCCLALAACSGGSVPALKKTADMEQAALTETLMGCSREALAEKWGAPAAAIDTYGDVWAVDAENCLIIYFDSQNNVSMVVRAPGTPDMYAKAPAETTAADTAEEAAK